MHRKSGKLKKLQAASWPTIRLGSLKVNQIRRNSVPVLTKIASIITVLAGTIVVQMLCALVCSLCFLLCLMPGDFMICLQFSNLILQSNINKSFISLPEEDRMK